MKTFDPPHPLYSKLVARVVFFFITVAYQIILHGLMVSIFDVASLPFIIRPLASHNTVVLNLWVMTPFLEVR